jgi:hypothetical protein
MIEYLLWQWHSTSFHATYNYSRQWFKLEYTKYAREHASSHRWGLSACERARARVSQIMGQYWMCAWVFVMLWLWDCDVRERSVRDICMRWHYGERAVCVSEIAILDACLFVWDRCDWLITYCFVSRPRIFHLYEDVTITGNFRPMLGAKGLWVWRDIFHATPTMTRNLGFSGLIRRTAPFSRLIRLYVWDSYVWDSCMWDPYM